MVPDNEHTNFFFFFEQRYKYLSSWLTNKSFSQRNAHDIVLRQPKISISSYQSLVIESINEHGNIRINICLWLFQIKRKKRHFDCIYILMCTSANVDTYISIEKRLDNLWQNQCNGAKYRYWFSLIYWNWLGFKCDGSACDKCMPMLNWKMEMLWHCECRSCDRLYMYVWVGRRLAHRKSKKVNCNTTFLY